MTAATLHYLHYTTTTTPLRYNYDYSCSTPHYFQQLWVRWPLQSLQPLQQTQLQPPFGHSVDPLCLPWFTTTNLSYRFPILKLPPPPCAVLLVLHMCIPEDSKYLQISLAALPASGGGIVCNSKGSWSPEQCDVPGALCWNSWCSLLCICSSPYLEIVSII